MKHSKAELESIVAALGSKQTGIEILGVMCSATGDDQVGWDAISIIKIKSDNAGTRMSNSLMVFKNGTELLITHDNYDIVDMLWTPFRQSFFTPEL